MAEELQMIDAWVNPNPASPTVDPAVATMFPGLAERRARGTSLSQLIDEMDDARVVRAVLCAGYRGMETLRWMEDAIAEHPNRFAGSIVVDPREGMKAVRLLESTVRNSGVILARVMALETQLPYDHAAYYPVYAKCIELGIPISANVGIPGPRVPGKYQHPLALDDVCCFFPELTMVMAHGGDPWADLCVKLMAKWPNLYYMSSAFAPKRLPPEVIRFMNGKGMDKVLWASDFPILDFRRCRDDILGIAFRDEDRRHRFAYGNAHRLLFGSGVGCREQEPATPPPSGGLQAS